MKKRVLTAAIAAMCFVGTAPVSAVPITGVAENLQEQTVLTENDDAVTTTIAVTGTQPVTTITMSVVDDPTMQTSVVTVTIMDINGDIVLVKPVDGSPELKSSSKFSLSAKQLSADINPKVGMKLKVTYSGGILETYPAQFGNVQKVTIVSETANDKEAQKPLISEDDILELSKKGDELTWSDFEKYEFTDIGDGTNIWQFVIKNSGSKLLVIGRNLKEKPEHINCVWGNGAEFDIRTEDLTPWFYDGAITTTIAVTETKPVTTITMPVVDEPTIQTAVVTVTIMDISGDNILVKPVDGSPELKSSSKFYLSSKKLPDDIKPKVGMKLEITYNGGILETYPAMFGNIQKITVATETDTDKEGATWLKGTKDMTLKDVIELAKKGNDLDWSDFKDYNGRDVGSGLHIWEYKLEDGYVLDVGGDIMTKPMYILLKRNNDKSIDIRTEDIKEYIASTATPVVTENEKVEATSPTSKSLIINDDINEYVEVIDAFMIQNKIDGDVSIHKIDGFDKVVVVCEKYDEHIKVKEYIESNGFDINKIHFGFTTSEGGLNSPDKLMGDANCDGQVDLSDAVMIMQALANPNKYGIDGTAEHHLTEQGKLNADMNGDGLTVGDAQAIQRKLLGIVENEALIVKLNTFMPPDSDYVELKPDEPMVSAYNPIFNSIDGVGVWFEFASQQSPVTVTAEKGTFKVFTYKSGGLGTVDEVGKTYKLDKSGAVSWVPGDLSVPDSYEAKIQITGSNNADLGTLVITKNPNSSEGVFCVTLKKAGGSNNEFYSSADYPCAIKINGTVFWQTNEKFSEDFSNYTVNKVTAYSENGTPQNDGESNFDRKCTTEYIIIDENTIVVKLQEGLVGYWIFRAK